MDMDMYLELMRSSFSVILRHRYIARSKSIQQCKTSGGISYSNFEQYLILLGLRW